MGSAVFDALADPTIAEDLRSTTLYAPAGPATTDGGPAGAPGGTTGWPAGGAYGVAGVAGVAGAAGLGAPAGPVEPVGPAAPVAPAGAGAVDDAAPTPARRKRRWPRRLAIAAACLAILGGLAYGATVLLKPSYPTPAITPAVLASKAKLAHGFTIRQHHIRRDGTTAGQILAQQPAASVKLAQGGTIVVTVSDGPALGTVPDLTNLGQATATADLRSAGYVPVQGATPYSNAFPAGTVLDWEPRGTQPHGTQWS